MQIPAHVNIYHQLDEPDVVELSPEDGERQWNLAVNCAHESDHVERLESDH